ncbi:Txe/YoeB family addiction module toxin [Dyadobacter tibetensis]|uniref:Txe/YoeB family addiction module toxin n=1 Tax=Dyadobacter tibetensis TaxID=1211851 RepID=UPI00046FCE61|nr:Txe/YoeB family addiction module toxin [Dyadobacter tibetensis]
MGKYIIQLSKDAKFDLQAIKRSGRKSDIEKISIFFGELENDPRSGTGMPERLKHYNGEVWSRRINKKDRLIYEILETEMLVLVVSVLAHYSDK